MNSDSTIPDSTMSEQNLFDWCLSFFESDTECDNEGDNEWKGPGYCCMCNSECNPASQCCGPCLRNA